MSKKKRFCYVNRQIKNTMEKILVQKLCLTNRVVPAKLLTLKLPRLQKRLHTPFLHTEFERLYNAQSQ